MHCVVKQVRHRSRDMCSTQEEAVRALHLNDVVVFDPATPTRA